MSFEAACRDYVRPIIIQALLYNSIQVAGGCHDGDFVLIALKEELDQESFDFVGTLLCDDNKASMI